MGHRSGDKTLDSFFKPYHIEINEQAGIYPGEFHICQKLCLMNVKYSFHAFQFQDECILQSNNPGPK